MIVGIVLIHSGLEVKDMAQAPVYDYLVVRGIIGTFTRVCVPLFFIISGYLFFAHLEKFGREEYLYKLRRRGRSLLEPYLFYNGLAVCLFAVLGLVKPELQGGTTPPVSQWTPAVVASLFWDYGGNLPMVPQFWFVRNLMCIVVATPLIYWLVRTTKGAVVILLAVLWGGKSGSSEFPAAGTCSSSRWGHTSPSAPSAFTRRQGSFAF